MSEEERPEEPRTKQDPAGETLLGGGYGAGGDITMLVPPPDDLGIGVSPVTAEGPIEDQPGATGTSDNPETRSPTKSHDPESGTVSVNVAFLILAFAVGAAFIHQLRDDARTLIPFLVLCAIFGLGYQTARLEQTA